MRLPSGQVLGYCTNVHPYRDVEGLVAALERHAAPLRRRLLGDDGPPDARPPAGTPPDATPLGVGLWFPASVVAELAADAAPLRRRLAELGLFAFTVNAFPWGAFHAERVKDEVFRPTWAEPERLRYTLAAAEVLADLLPEGETGSISTHSGAYKPWGAAANSEDAIVAGWLAAAEGLRRIESRTGRRIVLAIEPEPLSFLETTAEVVDLFTRRLQGSDAARTHLGLCYDACHQAVEFEDLAASVAALRAAGVALAKVQLSAALRLPDPAADRALLRPFAADRWFHQVLHRGPGGGLVRHADIAPALADAAAARAGEWRVHLHVPIFAGFLDDAGRLATTRPQLEALLACVGRAEVTPHLEIETYSYDLLPAGRRAALGAATLDDCLLAEFRWVLGRLGARPAAG